MSHNSRRVSISATKHSTKQTGSWELPCLAAPVKWCTKHARGSHPAGLLVRVAHPHHGRHLVIRDIFCAHQGCLPGRLCRHRSLPSWALRWRCHGAVGAGWPSSPCLWGLSAKAHRRRGRLRVAQQANDLAGWGARPCPGCCCGGRGSCRAGSRRTTTARGHPRRRPPLLLPLLLLLRGRGRLRRLLAPQALREGQAKVVGLLVCCCCARCACCIGAFQGQQRLLPASFWLHRPQALQWGLLCTCWLPPGLQRHRRQNACRHAGCSGCSGSGLRVCSLLLEQHGACRAGRQNAGSTRQAEERLAGPRRRGLLISRRRCCTQQAGPWLDTSAGRPPPRWQPSTAVPSPLATSPSVGMPGMACTRPRATASRYSRSASARPCSPQRQQRQRRHCLLLCTFRCVWAESKPEQASTPLDACMPLQVLAVQAWGVASKERAAPRCSQPLSAPSAHHLSQCQLLWVAPLSHQSFAHQLQQGRDEKQLSTRHDIRRTAALRTMTEAALAMLSLSGPPNAQMRAPPPACGSLSSHRS